MPPSRLLTTGAALCLAAAAMAQDAPSAPPGPGLSDLESTIGALEDAPAPEPAEEPEPAAAPAPEAETPAAETPPTPPAIRFRDPLTRAQMAALAAAGQRGRELAAIARAGIIGTQDMLSRVADPEGAGIAGWIAEPEGNAVEVIFYARGEDGPTAVFRANTLGARVVSREVFLNPAERAALSPIEARMAQARDATEGLEHQACGGQPFNVFVIPPASAEAPVQVYQISAATRREHFPLGGHFRSTVAADGAVADSHAFAEGCADLAAPPVPSGQSAPPLDVAHPADPLPTEIDAFLSLWSGRVLRVTAGDPPRVFTVAGERIAEVAE